MTAFVATATGARRVRRRLARSILAVAILAGACGHRTATDELVAANSRVTEVSRDAASGAVSVPGQLGPGEAPDAGPVDDRSGSGGSAARPASPEAGPGAGPTGGQVTTPGETGPIVVGSVGNYSGIAGPAQVPMMRAALVWADEVNSRGGLFGREIRVIVVDDRGDPAQHVAALRDLVEERGVVAFVVNAAALTMAAGIDYLEQAGVPVIGTACANAVDYESPIVFPQCGDVRDLSFVVVRAGLMSGRAGGTALAHVSCVEAPSCAEASRGMIDEGQAAEAGATVVSTARASLAQPDFTSECTRARQAGATMVNVVLDPTGLIRFGQSCARQGYHPLYVQSSATVFHDSKDQPGLAHLTVASQVFNFVGTETAARREFHVVMESHYGRSPGPAEAYGWAAAKLFEAAAIRAATRSQSISPRSLVDALHTFADETLDGLTVPLTFPEGAGARPAGCGFAAEAHDGAWAPLNGGRPICR